MEKSRIAIATITWACGVQEHELLREAMGHLAKQRTPVVIADGGSGSDFIDYLKSFPNFTVHAFEEPNLPAQTRWSLTTASSLGTEYVLYTESDKKLFFEHGLNEFIEQADDSAKASVSLASRTAESFLTFPEFQRYTEMVANRLCAEIIGQEGDFCYGPQLIHRSVIPCLELLKGVTGWEWRFYVIGIAHRLGYPIAQLALDLPCPSEQQEESKADRVYRMKQLVQNIQGLLISLSISDTQLQAYVTSEEISNGQREEGCPAVAQESMERGSCSDAIDRGGLYSGFGNAEFP